MKITRPFSSGSRQPPDPIDQYLAQVGFYRKHTARDSSSLYRAVSEQMFHTQNYHQFVRSECINYMGRIRQEIAKSIDRDVEAYLLDLAKPRAHGTLVELKALAHLFRRNVILFKEFDTGNWLIDEPDYAANECLMLFYTVENHFDSVFDQTYIEDAAFCQSLCYEVLYAYVYKLPDVEYAVERMLHDPTDGSIITSTTYYIPNEFYNDYPSSIVLSDDRFFRLDRPENTRCVLEDYKMCHFHNENFEALWLELRSELTNCQDQYAAEKTRKMLQSLLPEKVTSCVRQLLLEGITPFPYKVAKALDPCIYRNIEYDTWSEMRRELRMRHWNIGHNLQVGSKCRVRLYSNQVTPYVCHIQDIRMNSGKCSVFIEELAEKRCVPFSAITAMEYANPHGRYHHHYHHNHRDHHNNHGQTPFTKKSSSHNSGVYSKKSSNKDGGSNSTIKYEYSKQAKNAPLSDFGKCGISTKSKAICADDDKDGGKNHLDLSDVAHHLTSTSNFRPNGYEIIAAPVILGGNGNSGGSRTTPSKVVNNGNHRNNNHGGGSGHHYSGGPKGGAQKGKLMSGGGGKNFSENHSKFSDKPKSFQCDTPTSDLMMNNHHVDDSTQHSYHSAQQPRHGQQQQPPPFGYFYYYDNPWNEATYDPHVDPHRLAANNGYGAPPRLDRLRHIYENPNTHLYIPSATGIYSDFGQAHVGHDANGVSQQSVFDPNHAHFYSTTSEMPIKRRDLLEQTFSVNLDAHPSFDPRGHDIAINDPGTLRFFYNLGHEYFGQLRTRFGMPALAQLTQFSTEKMDPNESNAIVSSGGHFYPDCFGQQSSELDSVVYKTSNMKLGGKIPAHAKSEPSAEQRRQGGQGKTGHSKRYSTNRSNASNECDSSVSAIDSDSKLLTPLPQHSKSSIDTALSTVDNNSQHHQFDASSFHTPQRYHQTTEHAQPLLKTPVPIEGSFNNTMTTSLPELSPMAPVIPMAPAGHHSYPQYIPIFPMDEQQAMYMQMPCAYGGPPGFQTFAPFAPAPPPPQHQIHGGQQPVPAGNHTFIYGMSGGQHPQQIAMAPQGYWYPPPTIMPVQPPVSHVPVATPSASSISSDVPRSPLKANQTSSSPSKDMTNA